MEGNENPYQAPKQFGQVPKQNYGVSALLWILLALGGVTVFTTVIYDIVINLVARDSSDVEAEMPSIWFYVGILLAYTTLVAAMIRRDVLAKRKSRARDFYD